MIYLSIIYLCSLWPKLTELKCSHFVMVFMILHNSFSHISLCKEWFLFTREAMNSPAFKDWTATGQALKRRATARISNLTQSHLLNDTSSTLTGKTCHFSSFDGEICSTHVQGDSCSGYSTPPAVSPSWAPWRFLWWPWKGSRRDHRSAPLPWSQAPLAGSAAGRGGCLRWTTSAGDEIGKKAKLFRLHTWYFVCFPLPWTSTGDPFQEFTAETRLRGFPRIGRMKWWGHLQ